MLLELFFKCFGLREKSSFLRIRVETFVHFWKMYSTWLHLGQHCMGTSLNGALFVFSSFWEGENLFLCPLLYSCFCDFNAFLCKEKGKEEQPPPIQLLQKIGLQILIVHEKDQIQYLPIFAMGMSISLIYPPSLLVLRAAEVFS